MNPKTVTQTYQARHAHLCNHVMGLTDRLLIWLVAHSMENKPCLESIICLETNRQLQLRCLLELYDQGAHGPRAVTCYCYLTTLAQHQLPSKYVYLPQ